MIYFLKFITVFFAMFLADICWALYFIKVSERKSIAASIWAVGIYLCGAFTITSYIENKSFIIPAILGSFLGTYVTIEYKKKKEKKNGSTK
jgi:hypothetical protein